MENLEQEITVKKYQDTKDAYYFEQILEFYRERIQGRAYNASKRFGLDDVDCESALSEALWEACKTWDGEKGVPFNKYVSVKFNQALNSLFQTNITRKQCPYEIVYMMVTEGDNDLVDMRQDVENFVADEEMVKQLLDYIKEEKGVAAEVSVLRASGYENTQIAKALGYEPTGVKNLKEAQRLWSTRRLKDAQKPTLEFYHEVMGLDCLPIHTKH